MSKTYIFSLYHSKRSLLLLLGYQQLINCNEYNGMDLSPLPLITMVAVVFLLLLLLQLYCPYLSILL